MKIRKLKTIKSSAESLSNQQCTRFTAQNYQSFPMLEKPTMCQQNITKNNHLKIELQTKILVTKQTAKLHQTAPPCASVQLSMVISKWWMVLFMSWKYSITGNHSSSCPSYPLRWTLWIACVKHLGLLCGGFHANLSSGGKFSLIT